MRKKMGIQGMAGLVFLALLSCGRNNDPWASGLPEGEGNQVRIVLAQPATKAVGVVYDRDEEPVGRWAYFVFEHATGRLSCRGEVADGRVVTRKLKTGEYDIEVIANYPVAGPDAVNMASVGTRTAFQALKVSLGDNALGAFVMAGGNEDTAGNRIPFTVVKSESILQADIHLKRLVSKVRVTGISRQFTSASLAAKQLILKGVYLTNIYTQARYGEDYSQNELETTRSLWYNALGWHKEGSAPVSDGVDVLVGERGMDRSLAQGETASLDVDLYFFPNPVRPSADIPSSGWTGAARCTRLVVWVQVDGRDYYYPATLPKEDAYAPIGRNCVFNVSCTLTALGSTEEDDWVPGAMEVSFEPVLKDNGGWDGTAPVTEES